MRKLFLAVMLVVGLAGCGPNGCGPGDISVHHRLSESDVVGVWRMHGDCVEWLARNGIFAATKGEVFEIELQSGGKCRYRSLLEVPERYVDCTGSWALRQGEAPRWDPRISFGLVFTEDKHGSFGMDLSFTEIFGGLEMYSTWGDPDACRILRYARVAQPGGPANASQLSGPDSTSTPRAAGPRR